MYRIFSINTPFNILLYALVFGALQTAWWMQPQTNVFTITHAEPLSQWLFSKITALPNSKPILQSLGFALSFAIALLLNFTVASNKILPSRTYITGIVFLLLLSLVNDFATLTPELIALFFLLRITQKSLRIAKEEKANGHIFDLGWLSALSTLFYFPSVWLLVFSILILITFRSFSLREWLMVLVGFVGPFFFIFSLYFWADKGEAFFTSIINAPNVKALNFSFSNKVIGAVVSAGVLLLFSASALPRILFSNTIQIRKFSGLLLIMFILIGVSSFLQAEFDLLHFSMLCLPLSIIGTMYFQSLKGVFLSEILLGMLVLSAVIVHFLK